MNLNELCIEADCDKKIEYHGYAPLYDQCFGPLRDTAITFAEVGILEGASLSVWSKYFSKATIYGYDINPHYLRRVSDLKLPRVHTHLLDQGDPIGMDGLAKKHGPYDIIIDDGSHQNHHVISTFKTLWPHVKSGGWYAIEDMHTYPYRPEYSKPLADGTTSISFFKQLVDEVNFNGQLVKMANWQREKLIKKRCPDIAPTDFQKTIDFIIFRCGLVILHKLPA